MTAVDLTCTNVVGFGNIDDRFGRISWLQKETKDNKDLEIQLKVFRRDNKAEFRKHQKVIQGNQT